MEAKDLPIFTVKNPDQSSVTTTTLQEPYFIFIYVQTRYHSLVDTPASLLGGFSSLSSLSSTGIVVLRLVEGKLLLVPGSVVGVGENVEGNGANTHNTEANNTDNGQSVNNVGGSNVERKSVLHG